MDTEATPACPAENSSDQTEPRPFDSNDTAPATEMSVQEPDRIGNGGDHEESDKEKHVSTNGTVRVEKYNIKRESDDHIIAVWTDVRPVTSTSDDKSLAEAIGDPLQQRSSHPCQERWRDPRIMTLQHFYGERFVIPWVLSSKWSRMKEIIKLTYGANEDAKKQVDEGKFELLRDQSKIMTSQWDMIAMPWQFVTIKLEGQKPPTPLAPGMLPPNFNDTPDDKSDKSISSESADKPTVYQTTVKYRIDFFVKDRFSGPGGDFLESKTLDTPADMEKSSSRGHLIPVLEEINQITFGSQKNTWRKNDVALKGLILDVDDTAKPKKLHIRSPLLLNALRSIVSYSSNPPNGDDPEAFTDGLFPFPFKELYHHREELLEFKSSTGGSRANHTPEYNAECDHHIDILIDYLDKEPTVQLNSVKEKWAQKVPTTTFAAFWLLMKPGADVYVQEHGQLNAYVIDLVNGGIDYSPWSFSARNYSVRVWHLVFNGQVIKRKSKLINVPVFDGERDIVSLPLFPTSFHDKLDDGALRKRLIERGQKYLRLARGPTFLEYSGSGMKPGWKKYDRARVVVEHQSLPWTLHEFHKSQAWHLTGAEDETPVVNVPSYPPPPPLYGGIGGGIGNNAGLGERARAPRCECSRCKIVDSREGTYISPTFGNYDDIDPNQVEYLTEHQALMCMSHMFGFLLKDRAYDILDLSNLSKPILAESAIDELVLRPERNKDTIKAIARTYTESDSQADLFSVDFIRGKGEGQIFLLHGPPGTGKTLTAESVAEYTKRPLLSITAADLGHEPVELEENLLRFFKNATAWDAIVLLDEADVYLERRSSNDLRRNSIVSIFLRALDYFEGILFFTTNRVGHFDEAFMSRIHVAIGYDPLDDKAREQIWDALFRKLKTNHKKGGPQIDYEYDAKQYVRKDKEVTSLKWNGREIRNAFQTAVALAIADSKTAREKGLSEAESIPQVTEAHLSQVVHMSAAFKRYIMATHEGINESDMAYRLGNRNDQLVPESP